MPSVVDIDVSQYVNTPMTSEDFEVAGHKGVTVDGKTKSFTDTEMRTLHNMFSKWSGSGLNAPLVLDNFNRFYALYPEMEMPNDLKTYVFITRPEMNLLGTDKSYALNADPGKNLSAENYGDNRLQYLYAMNPEIVHMLSSDYSDYHQFIPYLQGRTESLQLPDYQIRTSDFTIPFYSYKYTYPTVTNESITGGTFDITFREDSDLRITKMFQFWVYYQDAIMKNKMSPDRYHLINNYYDFMCSVYEMVCDPTSERLLYWAKYTGCFPTSVPISNLSHNLRSTVDNKVSVTFNYMMVECLEPRVIQDFNENSSQGTTPVAVYDEDNGMVGDSLVGFPYIVLTDNQNDLLLKWYPRVKGRSSSLSSSVPTLSNLNNAIQRASAYRAQIAAHRDAWGISTSNYSAQLGTALGNYLTNNSDSI